MCAGNLRYSIHYSGRYHIKSKSSNIFGVNREFRIAFGNYLCAMYIKNKKQERIEIINNLGDI
jgi:hypothetical protein